MAAPAQRGPVGGHQLAGGVGWSRCHTHPERHLLGGDGQADAGYLQRQRAVADRPDDHQVGHRRAARPLDPQHPQRRRPLVSGLQRTGGESDLANLRTAVLDGNETTSSTVRRSGSPPPTSPSGACSSCGPTPPPSSGDQARGITALIVDMEVEGIECRPIRDIAGDEMFNEVFFTDARVPADYRLGDEGLAGRHGHARPGTGGHGRVGHHHAGGPGRHDQPGSLGEPRGARDRDP